MIAYICNKCGSITKKNADRYVTISSCENCWGVALDTPTPTQGKSPLVRSLPTKTKGE